MTDIITFLHSPLLTMLQDSPLTSLATPNQLLRLASDLSRRNIHFQIQLVELSSPIHQKNTIVYRFRFLAFPNFCTLSTMSDNRILEAFFSDFQVN